MIPSSSSTSRAATARRQRGGGSSSSRSGLATPYFMGGPSVPTENQNLRAEISWERLYMERSGGEGYQRESPLSGVPFEFLEMSAMCVGRDMETPSSAASPGGHRFSVLGLQAKADLVLSSQDFMRESQQVDIMIGDLKERMQVFDPNLDPDEQDRMGNAKGPRSVRRGSRILEEDDGPSLAERMELYKMHRKVESELPPLVPLDCPMRPRTGPQKSLVKLNASPEVLQRRCPEKRKEWLEDKKMQKAHHMKEVAEHREQLLTLWTVRWEASLEGKQHKAMAASSRQGEGKKATHLTSFAERWFGFFGIAMFARQVHEELKIRKMPTKERMEYIKAAREAGNLKVVSTFMKETIRLTEYMEDDAFASRIELLTVMFHTKLQLQKKRMKTRIIHKCLSGWHVHGRCYISLRRYLNKIRQLQRWWRQCAQELNQVNDTVSKRWEALERADLMSTRRSTPAPTPTAGHGQEMLGKSADSLGSSPNGKSPSNLRRNKTTALDPEIEKQMIDEAVRLRFIQHEMRARRYWLLPAIKVWEDDKEIWARDIQMKAMGMVVSKSDNFIVNAVAEATIKLRRPGEHSGETPRLEDAVHSCCSGFNREALTSPSGRSKLPAAWKSPPIKPTYSPPMHLASEAYGKPCPEWCIGRQGDKEIMDMIRRLRSHPEGRGWKEIPVHSPGVSTLHGHSQMARQERSKQDGLFGDAAEPDDLKRWGIDPALMPGLRTGADTTYKPAL